MSTKHYRPELGQAFFGNPAGAFEVPDYARALVLGIINDIWYAFWNRNQRDWDRREDPRIPGLTFRPYYWGDDEEEAAKPNLTIGDGLELRWYKHTGRGLSSNIWLDEKGWREWFDRAHTLVRKADPE